MGASGLTFIGGVAVGAGLVGNVNGEGFIAAGGVEEEVGEGVFWAGEVESEVFSFFSGIVIVCMSGEGGAAGDEVGAGEAGGVEGVTGMFGGVMELGGGLTGGTGVGGVEPTGAKGLGEEVGGVVGDFVSMADFASLFCIRRLVY